MFARQIEALGKPDDVLFALSTSGNSENVLQAALAAQGIGASVVGLTGRDGRILAKSSVCDIIIRAPTDDTPHVQECHAVFLHALCEAVEDALVKER